VATRKSDGSLWLYQGTGKGWVATGKRIGNGFGIFSLMAAIGDDTGDGNPDLAGIDAATGILRIYATNGSSGFRSGYTTAGSGWGIFDSIVGVGDLDGDGHPDLVARVKGTGELRLYRGNGTGGFHAGVVLTGNYSGYQLLAGSGDWNGDGIPDLMAVNPTTTQLALFPGKGAGSTAGFGPAVAFGGHGWNIFDSMS
jgi:hypothetical protein